MSDRGAVIDLPIHAGKSALSSIVDAISVIASRSMIIVVDDEDRENEGDLVMAADDVTPEHIAFMMVNGRGLICTPMVGSRLDELGIQMMVTDSTDPLKTAFTHTVDLVEGTTTGISAADSGDQSAL